ncbi:Retroelement [Phytophthora megakarya]|uniref:Retroelement n=1 Tax=Phytophthora megakarya TaxID=4795 RepID=A0A225WYR4_9STRA|nr:Retroelement [Phytophthora megakarya]
MRKGRILDSARVNGVSNDEIFMFFAEFKDFLINHPIDATCIYNCDETGIDPQGGAPVKVIGARGARNVSVRRGSNRENTSVLMAVSGAGVVVPPLFVIKGKHKTPSNLLHGAPGGSRVTTSPNAFVTTDIFEEWVDHFVENIPPRRPVLLLLDNHKSHVALPVRRKCIANGIHLLSLPPHCTHIMQPLDAGCFRSFKSDWRGVVTRWNDSTKAKNIPRTFRARLIGEAMLSAFTPENIIASWKSTGIWPIDPKVVDRTIVSKDTRPVSQFARYEVTEDPLPIGKLRGRAVRSLVRDGVELNQIRSYTLAVREIPTPPSWEEKEEYAPKTLIDIGHKRLLTHEYCMKAEVENEEKKMEASELRLMKIEDAVHKKLRAALLAAQKRLALREKRRRASENRAVTRSKAKAKATTRLNDRQQENPNVQMDKLKVSGQKRASVSPRN